MRCGNLEDDMALLSKKEAGALMAEMGFVETDFDTFEQEANRYAMYGFKMEQTHAFEGNLRALGDRLGNGHRGFYFVAVGGGQVIVRAWAHIARVTVE